MSTMSAAPIIRTAWPSGSIAFLAISDPDLRHGNRVHIWNLAGSLAYYSVVLSSGRKNVSFVFDGQHKPDTFLSSFWPGNRLPSPQDPA